MSEINGLVTLEELPEREIFIELKKYKKIVIKEKIRKIKWFSNFLIENELKDWFYNKTKKLRLDKFRTISKLLNIRDMKIEEMSGKQGISIKHPRFPFDFTTKEGVRFVACALGDGCIHDKGIRYYNKNKLLINEFVRFSKKIFGNLYYKKYENETEIIISLPEIYKTIVNTIGLKPGRKSTREVHIPKFIFDVNNEKKIEFVSQFIDDEGYINDGNIGIDLGFDDNNYPFLIYDLKNLFKILDINSSVFPVSEYYSSNGEKRRMWRLGIFLFEDAKKLAQNLKLINPKKVERCKELLSLNRRELYRGLDEYVRNMKEIEKMRRFFTVNDLAKTTNRSVRHSRRIVNITRKLGTIELIKPACKGYKNINYATYRVVK